jgi:MinD-like ATPase involved in chromosome partitioning or flagellar assembly
VQVLDDPERLPEAVCETAVEGLEMLPGGFGSAGKARYAGWSLEPLLEQCSSEYDLVLIDGGISNNPMTLPMAAACEAAIVVARLGETDATFARQLVKSLGKTDANVLGCVLVGAEHPPASI